MTYWVFAANRIHVLLEESQVIHVCRITFSDTRASVPSLVVEVTWNPSEFYQQLELKCCLKKQESQAAGINYEFKRPAFPQCPEMRTPEGVSLVHHTQRLTFN